MASTPLTSLKTSISSASTTTSSQVDGHNAPETAEASPRPPAPDDVNDSGDEWGMEIGDLIIDLEADLKKDEMMKNDARNWNNNNSGKGSSAGGKNNQTSAISEDAGLNSSEKIDNPAKVSKSAGALGDSNLSQGSGRTKSKSKKGSKSGVNKHAELPNDTASSVAAKNASSLAGEILNGNRTAKAESSSSKSGRSHKKHSKNSNSSDKKNEPGSTKDGREKSNKAAKNNKHLSQPPTSAMLSMDGAAYTTASAPGLQTAATSKARHGVNPPSFSSGTSDLGSQCSAVANEIAASEHGMRFGKTSVTQVNKAPVMASTAHLGKHRKTSSLPSPMRYQPPMSVANSPSPLVGSALNGALALQSSDSRRERSSMHELIQMTGSKKIKLEKETKPYASGMTPNYGEGAAKVDGGSHASVAVDLPEHSSNFHNDGKMAVGQKKGEKKSTRANLSSNGQHGKSARTSSSGSGVAATLGGQADVGSPPNDVPTPSDQQRTVGTVTTYADIGVSTEPESLGPCEPGTSVHLSGIVWHETESGVLVVNVTWRNRSYVGTLLDATKHDWAPPRIPDADSDAEYRVKNGRSKRQRGANGNGTDAGRKGRKSVNAAADEYKCSPSSNKRRSAKMSESDVCSGNDGEMCATPSKSAKRARLSRTAAAKQAAKKVECSAAVKESSGDGMSGSGSGSSACSSPVFMECRYANCKKRYKDDNALKYHEVHAHQGEDIDDVDKAAREDRDSNAADSPKDSSSDNASTKSVEEMAASDCTGSPSTGEQAPLATAPLEMETESPAAPSGQAPFVVAQQLSQAPHADRFAPGYPEQERAHSNTVKKAHSGEPKRTRDEFSATFETSVASSCRPGPENAISAGSGTVSPYTLTDLQTSDSISLKAHLHSEPKRPYHSSRPSAAYGESSPPMTSHDHASFLERTTAAENESAQAVETLLQLQENSQDQLPGLTPYNQATQPPSALQSPETSVSSQSHSPSVSVDKAVSEAHGKPQSAPHGVGPQFRGHSKDGTPLPRMSVGVASSPRYAGGSYTHGAAAARSAQERSPHCAPAGPKTVKGKTVPIPTDPQQTRAPSASHPTSTVPVSSGSAKKQKRKKPKTDAAVKTATDAVQKPGHGLGGPLVRDDTAKPNAADRSRVKLEDRHAMQPAPVSHQRTQRDGFSHLASGNMQLQPGAGSVKAEPGAQTAGRSQGYLHPGHLHAQRHAYANSDCAVRTTAAASRDTSSKSTSQGRTSDHSLSGQAAVRAPHPHHAPSPSFPTDGQERAESQLLRDDRIRSLHSAAHATSRSLPGSRSLTPVNPSATAQHGHGQNHPQQSRDSTTPMNSQTAPTAHLPRPQRKGPVSSPPHGRRLSAESAQQKRPSGFLSQSAGFPSQQSSLFGFGLGHALPYDMGAYPATQFMNDPKILQHYGQIIQQEIQKDQKPKEPERSLSSSRRPVNTPSPNPQTAKSARPKSPPRMEERRPREASPKPQHFPTLAGAQLQAGQRVLHAGHASRESPDPRGAFQPAPKKPAATARAPSRGLSPHQQQATPSLVPGNRPARPRAEAERHHRREPSLGERPQPSSRTTPTVAPIRKIPPKEGYPDQSPPSPDKVKSGHPMAAYVSPGALHGAGLPMQYFAGSYQPHLMDPRSMPQYFAATAAPYMLHPGAAQFFHGQWPHSVPPSHAAVVGPEKTPAHSPHPAKLSRDRSSSGSRSPNREEGDRQPRDGSRGRDAEMYSSSKDRRSSDGHPQSRKSVTPDTKAPLAAGNLPGESANPGAETTSPQMQRHLHTHHHIHEGFSLLPPPHQYQFQMAAAASAAVMAGSEAAALAQFPKRDVP